MTPVCLQVCDLQTVRLLSPAEPWGLISIVSPGLIRPEPPPSPWLKGRLDLVFEDDDPDQAPGATAGFSFEHADLILDFYRGLRQQISLMVIHCVTGQSRSAAVAAALAACDGACAARWFAQRRPSRAIYQTLLEQARRRAPLTGAQ